MKQFKNLRTSSTTSQSWMQKTLEDAGYQLDKQLQSTLEEVAPLITKKRSKHKNMV